MDQLNFSTPMDPYVQRAITTKIKKLEFGKRILYLDRKAMNKTMSKIL